MNDEVINSHRLDWQSFAIVDGRLVTGQNPASSTAAAKALLKLPAPKAAEPELV